MRPLVHPCPKTNKGWATLAIGNWCELKTLWILLGVSFILVGCGVVSTEEVYGKYFVNYPFGSEILVLNRDSTYIQMAIINDPPDTAIQSGIWKFDSTYQDVSLYNGLIVILPFGDLNAHYKTPFDGIVGRGCLKLTRWSPVSLATGCEGYYLEKYKDKSSK